MSLADSIRRRTDEWVERKRQEAQEREESLARSRAEARAKAVMEGREEGRKEARAELLREFRQARDEGRLDELLAAYAYQPSKHETQYLENRG